MGTSTGLLRNPVTERPRDQMMGRSGAVGHICFLNSTHKHIKPTLTGYSRFIVNEKQYSG